MPPKLLNLTDYDRELLAIHHISWEEFDAEGLLGVIRKITARNHDLIDQQGQLMNRQTQLIGLANRLHQRWVWTFGVLLGLVACLVVFLIGWAVA